MLKDSYLKILVCFDFGIVIFINSLLVIISNVCYKIFLYKVGLFRRPNQINKMNDSREGGVLKPL